MNIKRYLLSPLLNVLFVGVGVVLTTVLERLFVLGFHLPVSPPYSIILFLVASGTVLFIGNEMMTKFVEKLKKPTLIDHIRQCSILYLLLLFPAFWILTHLENRGGLDFAARTLFSVIFLWGIIFNIIYLFLIRRIRR